MAERTWLAVALSLLVWYLWATYFAPPPPKPNQTIQSTTTEVAPPAGQAATVAPLFAKSLPLANAATLTSGKLNTAFSGIGGKLGLAEVTTYRETISKNSKYIALVSPTDSPFTGATLFSEGALSELSRGEYAMTQTDKTVSFSKSSAGVTVNKVFTLGVSNFSFDEVIRIEFPAGGREDWGFVAIPVGAHGIKYDVNDPLQSWEVVRSQNDSMTREYTEKLSDGEVVHQGTTAWLGFGNRYFSTVLVNQSELNPDVVFVKTNEFVGGYLRYPLKLKSGQKDITLRIKYFVGPKDTAELSVVPSLKELIDYGMFSWLAYPLLEVLRFFYRFIHNYGIAIILLTLSVRIVFYPLSLKAARSMKSMQKLQPQIQALKEKYKEDPQRFNQEQLNLFKAHKVNPFGGCVPMLVQLPVFFALYAVLGNSIELFHAPFFGWILDLSSKDPYYVFPVLMGISMFVQQKMTPAIGMDPMQQKMMLLMPVVFTFVMLNLPSGLTVYIFLSTLLQIAQQALINRESEGGGVKLATVQTTDGSSK